MYSIWSWYSVQNSRGSLRDTTFAIRESSWGTRGWEWDKIIHYIRNKLLLYHSHPCMEMECGTDIVIVVAAGLGGRVLLGPLAAHALRVLLVLLVVLRDVCCERIVGVGRGKEGLDREQDGADLEGGGPLVFQDV